MVLRFVYDGHGHRIEVTSGWGGLGKVRFLFDGREVEPVRSWFRRRMEVTTRDGQQPVPWVVESRSGPYGELQVRVWRQGQLVSGWS